MSYQGIQIRNRIGSILVLLAIFLSVSIAEASVYNTGTYPEGSFIDPAAHIDVDSFSIGSESYIAPFTSFTGEYAKIGSHSNVQDSGTNSGKIKIADNAVIAHGADLIGNVEIGNMAFVGFNSIINNSKIGDGAYIGVRSKITGIDIPAGKSVPAGSVIDSQDDIRNLGPVTKAQVVFVNDVIEVNRALAVGYSQLYENRGQEAFGKTGPSGGRNIVIESRVILGYSGTIEPSIGNGASIGNARVIGNVKLGDNARIDDGTSIRGDEGVPIIIGDNAQIGKDNTFHSLNKKMVVIGNDFKLGSDAVIHGPVDIGNNVRVGNRAVVFKSNVGNNVIIGDNAVVTGVKLLDGAVIPPETIVGSQADANKFNEPVRREGQATGSTPLIAIIVAALIPSILGLVGSIVLKNKH
ncbi:MAG: DapH/DapD/GlmU-related protein [Candidatus Methanoperedens sp.]|nr:DapH/DapD/GlmU-related protein [Candidatus Methanoperedens sp.]